MEILADKYKLDAHRSSSFSNASQTKSDIVEWLIWLFTLSEEDRLKAGIYVGSEGRDWIDRSALILSPHDLD